MKFCVLAILLLVPVFAPAQIIVPITQTLLPDGDIRYSVPIRVGNSDVINALLDTGSTGLRILPNAIAPDTYTDTGFSSLYAYGSGEDLNGTIATAPIAIGGAATDSPVSIEMVKTIGCMDFAPDCPAKLALPDYGIGGDGIAGQGFAAILGVGLSPATGAGYTQNPLAHIGGRRWIITLPEPGATAPGALILNPSDAMVRNFSSFPLTAVGAATGQDGGWADAIPACLNNVSTDQRICGNALLDTGSPGIIAYQKGSTKTPLWRPGDAVSLAFTAPTGTLTTNFAADRFPGSGLLQAPPSGSLFSVLAGVLPFYAYAVLYDAAAGTIGLQPRTDMPDFSTAPTATYSDPDTQIEVIKLNAPGGGAPAPAGGMVLPQVITPEP
jgi:hypothetical protein